MIARVIASGAKQSSIAFAQILILSPSKEEFQEVRSWRSSFDGLRMRIVEDRP